MTCIRYPSAGKPRDIELAGTALIYIGATMFDEEEPWFLMTQPSDQIGQLQQKREIEIDEHQVLINSGVVVQALVMIPCVARYGVPDVALNEGILDWLHNEQRLSTYAAGFEFYCEDRCDDSPACCILAVRLPKRLALR